MRRRIVPSSSAAASWDGQWAARRVPPRGPRRGGMGVAHRRGGQAEPPLKGLEHGVVDLLGQSRLRRLVVERQDGDGLDVGQAAAGKAVEAGGERQSARATGGGAPAPGRWPPRGPPPPPRGPKRAGAPGKRGGGPPANPRPRPA